MSLHDDYQKLAGEIVSEALKFPAVTKVGKYSDQQFEVLIGIAEEALQALMDHVAMFETVDLPQPGDWLSGRSPGQLSPELQKQLEEEEKK
jgi:hypothetical protein